MASSTLTCPTTDQFDHTFGHVDARPQERRVWMVAGLTVGIMILEIVTGLLSGSMALLADGVHMGTHALALGLAAGAYVFGRRYARDRRFSLGTGKAGDLAGFASAIMLGFTALLMMGEAIARLWNPEQIAYGEALLVAVLGLAVNAGSALALTGGGHAHHHHHHGANAGHDHDHAHTHADEHEHDHAHDGGHDNNLRAAVVHVIADALTSVGAIAALIAAWSYGWWWLDPLVAVVASFVILAWAYGLVRDTSRVLLDTEPCPNLRQQVTEHLEADGVTRVDDLHLWSVGSGAVMLVASVITHGDGEPEDFKAALPKAARICHPIIEVRRCTACASSVHSKTGV